MAPKPPAKPKAAAKPSAPAKPGAAAAAKPGAEAKPASKPKPAAKASGGKGGRIIILAVVLLLVVGGGVGATIFILNNVAGGAAAPPAVEEVPGYVALDGVAVPVSLEGALDHYASLDLRLQVRDKARQAEVEAVLPRIRDALIRDAHRNALLRTDGVASVDLARIKERAKAAANQILGEDLIGAVLVIRIAKLLA